MEKWQALNAQCLQDASWGRCHFSAPFFRIVLGLCMLAYVKIYPGYFPRGGKQYLFVILEFKGLRAAPTSWLRLMWSH